MSELEELFYQLKAEEPLLTKYLASYSFHVQGIAQAPIIFWAERGEIEIFLNTDRNVFKKMLKRITESHKDKIKYCYFNKTDGSCSPTISIYTYLGTRKIKEA